MKVLFDSHRFETSDLLVKMLNQTLLGESGKPSGHLYHIFLKTNFKAKLAIILWF